jgi:hypothetical protein
MNFYRAGGHILNMDHLLFIAQQKQWDGPNHYFTYLVIMKNGVTPTTLTLSEREYNNLMEEVDQNRNPWRWKV